MRPEPRIRVRVFDLYSDRERIFEGDRDLVHQQLLEAYPFAAPGPLNVVGDIEGIGEILNGMQAFDAEVAVSQPG